MSGRTSTVIARLSAVGRELLQALTVGVLEGTVGGALLLGMIAGTLLVMIVGIIGGVALYLLSLLLFFSSFAQSAMNFAINLLAVAGFLVVPLGSAAVGLDLLNVPDGELTVDPSGWEHPVVIPLVGIAAAASFAGIVLPPWSGILEPGVAGVLAGVVLYRGSLYPVMLDDGRNSRYLSDPLQRRVGNALPDGTLVGPAAFALGLGWLGGAVTVSVVGFVWAELVTPLETLPLFPPPPTAIVGVPLALGIGQATAYGLREATIEALVHQRWLRSQSAMVATHCRTAGTAAARAATKIVRKSIRAVEYAVLLRP
jgi:hypothetical protein